MDADTIGETPSSRRKLMIILPLPTTLIDIPNSWNRAGYLTRIATEGGEANYNSLQSAVYRNYLNANYGGAQGEMARWRTKRDLKQEMGCRH